MKRIRMYGREFEVKRVSARGILVSTKVYRGFNSLEQCYTRPSCAKQAIYKSWCEFFRINFPLDFAKNDDIDYGIFAFNSHTFTFRCTYKHAGYVLDFYITPAHNRLTIYEPY